MECVDAWKVKDKEGTCPICRQKLVELNSFATLCWEVIDKGDVEQELVQLLNRAVAFLAKLPSNEKLIAFYQPIPESTQKINLL